MTLDWLSISYLRPKISVSSIVQSIKFRHLFWDGGNIHYGVNFFFETCDLVFIMCYGSTKNTRSNFFYIQVHSHLAMTTRLEQAECAQSSCFFLIEIGQTLLYKTIGKLLWLGPRWRMAMSSLENTSLTNGEHDHKRRCLFGIKGLLQLKQGSCCKIALL